MTQKSSESGCPDAETNKKSDTSTEHEKVKEKKERVRAPTKVVIRRLPPTMTKDEFLNFISPVPEHDFLYFVCADKSLGANAFSRAYINFSKQEDIFTFKDQFDNYTFMDKKGNEYPAVVEFAPFERLPKKRALRKKDPKMKTLQQDATYIAFLESQENKSADAAPGQYCALEYFPPPEKEKVTTTPLLDFLRQRRAEKQRMRDERREERRRKDQERKRLKDSERDRRHMPNKVDTTSIPKVLRNPDVAREMKEDNVKEKQSIGSRKHEEDRQHHKDIRRETRSHTSVKSYRDDRQKQMEMRAQRKTSDEQRKKLSFERSQMQNKTSDNHPSDDADKSQDFKTSETHRSQEFERSHSFSKPTDSSRRGQDYDRHSRESKYQRKMGNERYKAYEHKKTYKEPENRRSSYNKDMEQKKKYASNQRQSGQNYSVTENRKNIEDKKNVEKVSKEIKTEKKVCEEAKKWENMGAKPKKSATEDTTVEKVESVEEKLNDDKVKELVVQTNETSPENEAESSRQETAIKEPEEAEKNEVKNSSDESHLSRTERSKSEEQNLTETANHGAVLNMRRGSLDSGDHEAEMSSNRMQRNLTGSDWSMEAKVKRNHSLEMEQGDLESEKSVGDSSKAEDKDKNGEQKRDPRVERRIRNKDRPSIEIYRPGMGKFSMQRKELEKSTSSMEQESPSSSPSPTPVNVAQLRSMTFKRSVSREK